MHRVSCPQCGHRLKYSAEHAGKKAKCQKCGCSFRLPAEAASSHPDSAPPPAPVSAPVAPAADTPCCVKCGQAVDPKTDRYEFIAFRKVEYGIQLGGVSFLQETLTFRGLIEGADYACPTCVGKLKNKYLWVWWTFGTALLVTATAALIWLAKTWEGQSRQLAIIATVFVTLFGFIGLGIFFTPVRKYVGQRIVITARRPLLKAIGLGHIRGGRLTYDMQYFTRTIFD